jgi:hypothetical protein
MKHYSQISFGYMHWQSLLTLFPYTMLLIVCSILAASRRQNGLSPSHSSQSFNNTAAIVAEIASFKKPQNKTVYIIKLYFNPGSNPVH